MEKDAEPKDPPPAEKPAFRPTLGQISFVISLISITLASSGFYLTWAARPKLNLVLPETPVYVDSVHDPKAGGLKPVLDVGVRPLLLNSGNRTAVVADMTLELAADAGVMTPGDADRDGVKVFVGPVTLKSNDAVAAPLRWRIDRDSMSEARWTVRNGNDVGSADLYLRVQAVGSDGRLVVSRLRLGTVTYDEGPDQFAYEAATPPAGGYDLLHPATRDLPRKAPPSKPTPGGA